jgi:hypothetical protein
MNVIFYLLITLQISIIQCKTAQVARIRGGIYSTENYTYITECISGKHLHLYEHVCASRVRLRIDAVTIAVLQVV